MKLNELTPECIEKHLNECLRFREDKSTIYKRYSAYDYCFNYFQDFYTSNKTKEIASEDNVKTSCMQLGLFLATWGMYRNSALHNRSFKVYEDLIKRISKEESLWKIDVEDYCNEDETINEETFKAITKFIYDAVKLLSDENNGIGPYKKIYFEEHRRLKHKPLNVTITLATKIMMGVFGCVPAHDKNFTEVIEYQLLKKKLFKEPFNESFRESLKEIHCFYIKNKDILEKSQKEFKTLDVNGGSTIYTYKKAKIIDLIGFRVRQEEEKKKDKKEEKIKLLNQYPVSQSS